MRGIRCCTDRIIWLVKAVIFPIEVGISFEFIWRYDNVYDIFDYMRYVVINSEE